MLTFVGKSNWSFILLLSLRIHCTNVKIMGKTTCLLPKIFRFVSWITFYIWKALISCITVHIMLSKQLGRVRPHSYMNMLILRAFTVPVIGFYEVNRYLTVVPHTLFYNDIFFHYRISVKKRTRHGSR